MPNGLDISLQFNDADRAAFQARVARMRNDLGYTPEEAMRIGVITFLKSVRASTKKAPARRKVRAAKTARGNWVSDKIGRRKRIFYAEALDRATGGQRKITIFAASLAEAKESPIAVIWKSGLARKSWGWMMHKLYGVNIGADDNPDLREKPGMVSASRFVNRQAGFAAAVLENNLGYIWWALGSRQPVDTALARANDSMSATIQQKINKATAEAGY